MDMLEVGQEVAASIAKKYASKMHSVSYDEFYAEALYLLQLATGSFNPDGGRSWKNYVYERINYGMIDFLRDGFTFGANRRRNNIIITFSDSPDGVLENMASEDKDPLDMAACSETLERVHKLLDELGSPRKEIFLAYVEGVPVAGIVEKHGYNPATINKALESIPAYLASKGAVPAYEMPNIAKPFSKEEAKVIRDEWKKGTTYVDLAKAYNTNPATVRDICLQLRKAYQE